MFGEGAEVGSYLQKLDLMAEKSSLLVDEFYELSEMKPTSADEAEAISTRMTEVYEEWMSINQEIIEQEQALTEKAAENLIELLEKQHELALAILQTMYNILELTMKQEGIFTKDKIKNSLLGLL